MLVIRLILVQIFLFCLFAAEATKPKPEKNLFSDTLKIATYNIRIKTSADTAARSWDNRRSQVAGLIHKYCFDVIGVQEIANSEQENDLKKPLTEYNFYSKGRENNAGSEGEKIALFYLKTQFTALDSGYFFLSETPEIASKGWDASYNRMCVWLKLQDKKTQQTAYYFNVHFDHLGVKARAESAKLLNRKIREIAANEAVFCLGDFNASPLETEFYTSMTQWLRDAKKIALSASEGTIGTFNGWDVTTSSFAENLRIDYVFTNYDKVHSYRVLTDKYVTETYPSDHFPVMIQVVLN
jgi:endonuclease/exonuclease/phosphatase family metal-dependent hydrolase